MMSTRIVTIVMMAVGKSVGLQVSKQSGNGTSPLLSCDMCKVNGKRIKACLDASMTKWNTGKSVSDPPGELCWPVGVFDQTACENQMDGTWCEGDQPGCDICEGEAACLDQTGYMWGEGWNGVTGITSKLCSAGPPASDGQDVCETNGGTWCPADPNAEPACVGSTCTISEDPHIEVFDGVQVSLLQNRMAGVIHTSHAAGDKWLVKSDRVSIQARYEHNGSLPDRNLFVRALAVGGEFLKGNTIVIGSLDDQITWNGESILPAEVSSFEVHGEVGEVFVKAHRGYNSNLVQDLSKINAGVNFELPLGVSLIVNRLHGHVNVAIKMCKQAGGQQGLCGNHNGVAADDSLELAASRFDTNVAAQDSLFNL